MSDYLPIDLRRQVCNHFAGCCAYCRSPEDLTVAIFEIEHIVPRSLGGPNDFENLCFACPTCNRYKSDRVVLRDSLTGSDVPLFHPQQDSWEAHFAWSNDFTEMVGLTPSGRATIDALRMNRPQLIRVRRMWAEMGEHPPEAR